jgi:N-methylhydantoinase A
MAEAPSAEVTDVAGARIERRPVHFGDSFVPAEVVDGPRLGPGATLEGPALVEEAFTVVVVPPGWRCRLTDQAMYELTPS